VDPGPGLGDGVAAPRDGDELRDVPEDDDQMSRKGPGDGVDPSKQQLAAADDELREALSGMAGLVAASLTLRELLTSVAEFAVRAIPGADGAGVTLMDPGRTDTIVGSARFVEELDAIQYGLGEGPCISAAAEGRTIRSGSLGGARQWPRFGPRAGRLGIHSALSLPLLVRNSVVGAINVYAHPKNAFTPHAERLGELFSAPAAVAVHNAQELARMQALATQLEAALTTRTVIDQAIGILMSRTGGSAAEAFETLRALSQRDHTKVAHLAAQIVSEAARRAVARRSASANDQA
jgi:transcriptional regulator with GAF, ATPase, and Fis domain